MDIHPDSLEQQAIDGSRRKHLHGKTLVGRAAELSDPGIAGLLYGRQRFPDEPEVAHHKPGTQGPLLTFHRAAERNPFRRARGLDARSCHPEIANLHGSRELNPLVQRKRHELARTLLQARDETIQLWLTSRLRLADN
jgi:hypothetical protein